MSYFIKLFVPTASFLYPLKTSENLMVFWSSEGVENGCIGNEWVRFKYQDFDRLMSSAVSFHHVPIQKNCMKKYRNMEFFLVRMQENMNHFSGREIIVLTCVKDTFYKLCTLLFCTPISIELFIPWLFHARCTNRYLLYRSASLWFSTEISYTGKGKQFFTK